MKSIKAFCDLILVTEYFSELEFRNYIVEKLCT